MDTPIQVQEKDLAELKEEVEKKVKEEDED